MLTDSDFATAVQEAMGRLGMDDKKLGKKMRASVHAAKSWRLGRRRPRDIVKFAGVLGTSVGVLLGERAA